MTSFDNLVNILQDGIIYPNKYLPKKYRVLSGSEQNFVYTNMFIDDYDIYKKSFGPTLLLHPKILYENGFYFNEAWIGGKIQLLQHNNLSNLPLCGQGIVTGQKYESADGHISYDKNNNVKVISKNSFHIKSTDSPLEINYKLNKIRHFLINPKSLPKILSGINSHEILFDHPIQLDSNLLAIVNLDPQYFNKIKNIIKHKPYRDVIFWNEPMFPKLDNINF